jgi:acyl-CoA thioester hydrolase
MSENTNEIAWDIPNPFTVSKTVESSQIDGLNHVNNAYYVMWCQDAGWGHSEHLGLDLDDYRELNRAMAIRRSEYDYILSAYEGDELIIGTWLTGNDNRLMMERSFQIVRVSDGATLLRGRWDLVCIDMASGKPKRMPQAFKDIYGAVVVKADESAE